MLLVMRNGPSARNGVCLCVCVCVCVCMCVCVCVCAFGKTDVTVWHRAQSCTAGSMFNTPVRNSTPPLAQKTLLICLVHDGVAGDDGQILLARNAGWPQGQMSVLAGFVEAGESVEACIAREIKEEVGLTVRNITYLGSQSWPFPRSLMLAYSAIADPHSPLQFSDGEIAAAKWMRRAEVRKYLTAPPESGIALSGAGSIARAMITAWAEDNSPQ